MDLDDVRGLEGKVEASHAILGAGGVDQKDRVPTTTVTHSPGWDGIRFNRDLGVGDNRGSCRRVDGCRVLDQKGTLILDREVT